MEKPVISKTEGLSITAYRNGILCAWVLLLGGLFIWNIIHLRQEVETLASNLARAYFNKDHAFRLWGVSHGGVYVPIDERTPPSPFLGHLEERDVRTPSGRVLTLMSPAYMLRQIQEDFAKLYGVQGHISSTKYLRAEAEPDGWERTALARFEKGESEFAEFVPIRDEPCLRFMKPLRTEKGCLKCHPDYREGQVHGGVSITLPLKDIWAGKMRQLGVMALSYSGITVIGLLGILVGSNRLSRREEARQAACFELEQAREHLEDQVIKRTAELTRANVLLRNEISERQEAQNKLSEAYDKIASEEHKLRTMIEGMAEGIVVVDANDLVTEANQWLLQRLGLRRDDVVGRCMWDFHPPSEATERVRGLLENYKSGAKSDSWETMREFLGMHTSMRIQPIFEGDQYRGVILNVIDVSDLVRARIAAENANQWKSQFLANMSHEIRTPLNGVVGMTELALNTPLTGEQQEYIEAVKMSADALLTLINDILDFSKMEAGKLELASTPFSIRECVANAMATVAPQAHAKGLEVAYDVPAEIPDRMIGDPGRLRQILLNLAGNAVKFTRSGEVVVKVAVAFRQDNEARLHFSVRDTGDGIPEDQRQRVFRAFEQMDGSSTREHGGTGLGLAIASQLVGLMHGDMWLDSEVGKGSTFHFTVSLQFDPHVAERTSADPKGLVGLRVLVVDDNATNRRILADILTAWGMKPTLAEDGLAALKILRTSSTQGDSFDLALVDFMMPDMDGFELVRLMREDTDIRVGTIIILTSGGHRSDLTRCGELGISAYLLKPIKQSDLLHSITMTLQGSKKDAEPEARSAPSSLPHQDRTLKILLAEDNQVNRRLAVRMLEKMGHSVTTAENGRKAVDLLEQGLFDLVFMDIQMPEMDGFQATAVIRDREAQGRPRIPILAMTAHAMSGDRERCLAAGMDGYVSKPIRARELHDAIEPFIGKEDERQDPAPGTDREESSLQKASPA